MTCFQLFEVSRRQYSIPNFDPSGHVLKCIEYAVCSDVLVVLLALMHGGEVFQLVAIYICAGTLHTLTQRRNRNTVGISIKDQKSN